MIDVVEEVVTRLAAPGRLVGLLGGEHSITVGAVTALARSHPDVSVLYLDAHADLRDEYMGSRWGHASVARRPAGGLPRRRGRRPQPQPGRAGLHP